MKYIISTLIIGLFSVYFATTIFFNFPEESIVIGENFKGYMKFQDVLYQKWTFFAPPPESNKRAYFEFTVDRPDGKSDVYEIELFEKFGKSIKEEYLFNDVVANTDWILFNYVESITDKSRTAFKIYKTKNKCKNDDCYVEFYKEFNKYLRTTKQMKFLIAHAKGLARKSKIPSNAKFRLKIFELPIPRYHQRYKKLKLNERSTFTSGYFNLKEDNGFNKDMFLNMMKQNGKIKKNN